MYDIFFSYAHQDNDQGWVKKFADSVARTFAKLTGADPVVFFDASGLITSAIWDKKISRALDESKVVVSVVSPSYVRSQWCQREWSEFAKKEKDFRESNVLPEDQGLIFPILLYPLNRGRFNAQETLFAEQIKVRQWLDMSSKVEGSPLRPEQIRSLTENILDISAALAYQKRTSKLALSRPDQVSTIVDTEHGLEWSGAVSSIELTFDEAQQYVNSLDPAGGNAWRLPTARELELLIDKSALDPDSQASPFPLKQPFNSQRFGYLHSGEPVRNGHYIMNVRNGHIFNGLGYKGYVRAVRALQVSLRKRTRKKR